MIRFAGIILLATSLAANGQANLNLVKKKARQVANPNNGANNLGVAPPSLHAPSRPAADWGGATPRLFAPLFGMATCRASF